MSAVRIQDFRVRFSLQLRDRVGKALDRASTAGVNHYRRNVPVRTGRLKRSARRFGNPARLVRAWGSNPSAPYSRYVEQGTRRMAARPRLKESVQVAGQVLLKELK